MKKDTRKEKKSSKPQSNTTSKKSKIDNYEKSKPVQLELFELMNPSEKDYSNTIELYDFMPKYFWGKADRIQGKFLEPIERELIVVVKTTRSASLPHELRTPTVFHAITSPESVKNSSKTLCEKSLPPGKAYFLMMKQA